MTDLHGGRKVQPRPAPKLWIDDANPIFRRGLTACLHADGFDVVGDSTGFTPEPVRGVDVLVFAAEDGGLTRAVRHVRDTGTRLVALVSEPVEAVVCDAVEAGVAAVLIRPELTQSTLTGCVRSVLSGHATLPTDLLDKLLDRAANGTRRSTGGLTPRELAVLRLLADGGDTKDIAETLNYSERTVKNVVHDVLTKMNCHNRAHAVATATRQGVI